MGAGMGIEEGGRIKTRSSAETFFNQLVGGVGGAVLGGFAGGPLAQCTVFAVGVAVFGPPSVEAAASAVVASMVVLTAILLARPY